MGSINLLNPLSSQTPEHENRITWAFLVALKYDPLLQTFFRELVESKLPPEAREQGIVWETARVSTQTKWIASSTNRLVSILLTNKTTQDIEVKWSDREAVYDGVIEFPSGLTLIVENKPSHRDVWEQQLSPSRKSFTGNVDDCKLHRSAICLEWSEVLEGMLSYVESGIAPFSSREISRDLLSYVEEFHSELTPYRTFRLCGRRNQALHRRTILLLDELASRVGLESRDDRYLFRPGTIAERVAIRVESESTLKVGLWPADTVHQARRFYSEVDRTAFLGLEDWEVETNLHFSYMNKHLIWAATNWETDRYFDYFKDGQSYGKMNRARLVALAEQWENEGLITREDRDKIEYQFNFTRRQTLNVIPGFSVTRSWDLRYVTNLEQQQKLEAYIIYALATPLSSWRETL